MKRLFAAVKIEADENFVRVFNALRAALNGEAIRWTPVENMHVTLKFFGETPENKIPAICDALREISPDVKAFDLTVGGTGMFGSRYKPRVVWFGIQPAEPLQCIAADIHKNILPLGYVTDRQNFVPHLTAGRMNAIRDKERFQAVLDKFREVKLQSVTVSEFHLYESVLLKTGPVYTVLETFPF